jgi:protein TonB
MNIHRISLCALAATLGLTAPVSMLAADQGPTPVSQTAPIYAFDLRHNDIEGEVTVSYTITATGNVENLAVVSSTDRAFERPTRAAVKTWRFLPATKDGVSVNTRVRQTISFQIPDLHPEIASIIARSTAKPGARAGTDRNGDR